MNLKQFSKKYKIPILILALISWFIPDPLPFVDEVVLGYLVATGWL